MEKILLLEGSSLSAREVIAALGPQGYRFDILDPNPYCVCKFSKYVDKIKKSPNIQKSPVDFAKFFLNYIQIEKFDFLLPTHEHSYLLAIIRDKASQFCEFPIADFESFKKVQSKREFAHFCAKNSISQPEYLEFDSFEFEKLSNIDERFFPAFVKSEFGTAGQAVWQVRNIEELINLYTNMPKIGKSPFIIQKQKTGQLETAQSVFQNGKLVAYHFYTKFIEGVGGSSAGKLPVSRPQILVEIERIGALLKWHGPLMIDYIFNPKSEEFYFIDPNPRIGETMNAVLNGVNLPLAFLGLLSNSPPQLPKTHSKKLSHIILARLLEIGALGKGRFSIFAEYFCAIFHLGKYRESEEEIAKFNDIQSIIPVITILFLLIIRPKNANKIIAESVKNYSLGADFNDHISELLAL